MSNATTTDEVSITGKRAKLPTKVLIALLAAVAAAVGWASRMEMELTHAHEMCHDLADRVKALERER